MIDSVFRSKWWATRVFSLLDFNIENEKSKHTNNQLSYFVLLYIKESIMQCFIFYQHLRVVQSERVYKKNSTIVLQPWKISFGKMMKDHSIVKTHPYHFWSRYVFSFSAFFSGGKDVFHPLNCRKYWINLFSQNFQSRSFLAWGDVPECIPNAIELKWIIKTNKSLIRKLCHMRNKSLMNRPRLVSTRYMWQHRCFLNTS